MRVVAEALVYAVLRLVWGLARLLPLGALRRTLEQAALIVRRLDRRHRSVVRENLERAFPAQVRAERIALERGAFRSWGRIAAELVHADSLLDSPRAAGLEELVSVLAEKLDRDGGRGLLVLTAHTGNYELLARLCARATGRHIWIFHRAMNNRFADAFLTRQRAAAGVRLLGRGSGVRQALELLSGGAVLAVPLDQNQQPGRGIFVDFFGVPASTSTLLARLSLACQVPVLPVFGLWSAEGLRVEVGDPIDPPLAAPGAGIGRADLVRSLTQRYTAEVERVVRMAPEQWNWAHRRWKTRPNTLPKRLGRRRFEAEARAAAVSKK